MNGYLLLDKPAGPTSHDMIYQIRKIAHTKKVGHTGTLDPMATGLMVVCIGNATKAADYITKGDKAYIASMELGKISDTLDITGTVRDCPCTTVSEEEIRRTLFSFLGDSMQMPPMYSAKKTGGKKLYEFARDGVMVDRKPVPITVKELEILSVDEKCVTFSIVCSKGTYIRSIIDDFGKKIGCGAVMTALRRVKSGPFSLEDANVYTPDELQQCDDIAPLLYPVDSVFCAYPKLTVAPHHERLIKNGIQMDLERLGLSDESQNGKLFRVYNQKDEFFAIMQIWENRFLKLKTTFYSNGEQSK